MPNSPLLQVEHTSDDTFLNDKINNNNNTPLISVTDTKVLNKLQRNDDSPLSMHENVTVNSPNHYRYNHHQTQQQQHHRQGKPLYDYEIYSPSFPSSLILNNYYNNQHLSSSSSLYNYYQQQQHQEEEYHQSNEMIIPTTLPPVLLKESISSQQLLCQEPFDPSYIDDFEIVRTKVTDITRTMQKHHITELDESMIVDQLDIKSPSSTNRPLSPLSILCPTTNSLIQTRVLEETGLYCDDDEDEDEDDEYDTLVWRNSFLDLMSTLITYSENLESISTELLRTEGKVRELVLLQKSMIEQYEEREKLYKDRLDECEQISRQQLNLIDHLIELDHDLDLTQVSKKNMASNNSNRRSVMTNTTTTTTTTLSTIYRWQSSEHSQKRSLINRSSSISSTTSSRATTVESRFLRNDNHYHHQWDFSKKISDIIHIKSMEDIVHTLRWEIGLWVGGGVGTGHVIHSFEGPLNGIELIIAGSGTIAAIPSQQQDELSSILEESYIQSSSIQHVRFHRHHYMLHINHHDRKTRFSLLPKYLWTPDNQVDHCQFKTHHNACSTMFSFFQRRHHCRRCGLIICQRHSLNRLPLFSSSTPSSGNNEKWHRVCDTCFHDLIIISAKK